MGAARRLGLLCFLLVIGSLVLASAAIAAPGDLDAAFGAGGIVSIPIPAGVPLINANSIVAAPGGKIVIAGMAGFGPQQYASVIRLNADGSFDKTFGGDGEVESQLGQSSAGLYSAAVQPDGKIVVGGYSGDTGPGGIVGTTVARFNDDGSFDSGFNSGGAQPGVYSISLSSTDGDYASGVALRPDGKVVVTGAVDAYAAGARWSILRLSSTGALDTAGFDTPTGYRTTGFGAGSIGSYAVRLRDDGRIVTCGGASDGAADKYSAGLLAYNETGFLDTAFGGGTGKVIDPLVPTFDVCTGLTLQPDGKILTVGYSEIGSTDDSDLALARFNADGTPDSGFGSSGNLIDQRGLGTGKGWDVALDAAGRIVAGGEARLPGNSLAGFATFVYGADGTPDPNFGSGGLAVHQLGNSGASAMTLVDRGRAAVLVGQTSTGLGVMKVKLFNDPPAPTAHARITSPRNSKMKARKFTRISGSAASSPVGAGISKVELALYRAGSKHSKKCLWLKSTKGTFRSLKKPKKTGCAAQVWLTVKGGSKWSLKLAHKLPRGKYTLYARATPVGGAAETTFSRSGGNKLALKLTAPSR